jgi:hypothetical protein
MASFLDTLFGGGAQQEAAQKDIAAANTYQGQALPALQQAYNTGTTAINQGIGAYTPLANLGATYSGGAPTLMNALGVNGPQGNAAATAAYQSSPGYQFQLDQGEQAIQRQNAIGGMGASGNALVAANNYAQGAANQDYQQWLTNLQNTGQMGLSATGAAAQGQAQGYGGLANLASQYGQNQANVYGNVEGTTVGANNLAAAGQQQGANNLLGAGLSLASLALGPAGVAGSGILGGLAGNSAVGNMPATGAGSPSPAVANAYALSQGINPWG